jgi:hypothetical protein
MIYSRMNQLVCLQEFQLVFPHLDIRVAACVSEQPIVNTYDCNSAHKKQNKNK